MQVLPNSTYFELQQTAGFGRRGIAPPRSPDSATKDVVVLVSDDAALARELEEQLVEQRLELHSFGPLPAVSPSCQGEAATCVILDSWSSGMSAGATEHMLAREEHAPLIVIGSETDIRATVRAIKAGAYDYFPKPCELPALLASVRGALAHDRHTRARRKEQQALARRYSLLTPREREVLPLVVGGLLNKQAASVLGISEITLQIHRGQVMRKMQADSLADLVRIAMKLKLPYWDTSKRQNKLVSSPSSSCVCVRDLSQELPSASTRSAATLP